MNDLVENILRGQERLENKTTTENLPGIQAILSRCRQGNTGNVLENLSQEFRLESRKKGAGGEAWNLWYFEGCMDLANYTAGKVAQSSNAAKAVCVINSIVDKLLTIDGPVALVVFGALAGESDESSLESSADCCRNWNPSYIRCEGRL